MIPPFIEYGRRNGKQRDRDIIGSLLYSADFMRERGVAIVTTEEKREYEKVRNKYESPFALNRKTDAEIAIEQAREIDNLKKLANEANEVIKKLNEENKALVEENAKLRKGNKELSDACEAFDKLCELAKRGLTIEMSALPIIEYQGMKFKATRLVIDENCGTRRTIHIDGTMVSE